MWKRLIASGVWFVVCVPVQYCTVQYSTVQYSTVQLYSILYCMSACSSNFNDLCVACVCTNPTYPPSDCIVKHQLLEGQPFTVYWEWHQLLHGMQHCNANYYNRPIGASNLTNSIKKQFCDWDNHTGLSLIGSGSHVRLNQSAWTLAKEPPL